MTKITAILPIFNVEKYLDECLESIHNQSYQDWEAILVNDGSTDSSLDICNKWENKDSRFKVINKPNGGVNTARNKGLDNAKGEYIIFIDSDDIIHQKTFEKTLNKIESDNLDMLVFDRQSFKCSKQIDTTGTTLKVQGEEEFQKTFSYKDLDYKRFYIYLWFMVVWGLVIKRSLLKNIRFPENLKMGEDQVAIKDALLSAKKIQFMPERLYFYRNRPGSAVTERHKKSFDIFQSYNMMKSVLEKHNQLDNQYSDFHRFFLRSFLDHLYTYTPYCDWQQFNLSIREKVKIWNLNNINLNEFSRYEKNKLLFYSKSNSSMILFTKLDIILYKIRPATRKIRKIVACLIPNKDLRNRIRGK